MLHLLVLTEEILINFIVMFVISMLEAGTTNEIVFERKNKKKFRKINGILVQPTQYE